MKSTLLIVITLTIVGLGGFASTKAQAPNNRTSTKMIYHNGPVVTNTPHVYLIWYGCWSAGCGNPDGEVAQPILTDLVSSLGSTPYFQINSTYPDSTGAAPDGSVIYVRSEVDPLASFGLELTDADIRAIVRDRIGAGSLPLDPSGVYIVLTSPNINSAATGLCTAEGNAPWHGSDEYFGIRFKYGLVGDPSRCPDLEAPQFVASDGTLLQTPNDNLTADAMAAKVAHVLSTIVTNPYGGAWFDKFGLENADKCQGVSAKHTRRQTERAQTSDLDSAISSSGRTGLTIAEAIVALSPSNTSGGKNKGDSYEKSNDPNRNTNDNVVELFGLSSTFVYSEDDQQDGVSQRPRLSGRLRPLPDLVRLLVGSLRQYGQRTNAIHIVRLRFEYRFDPVHADQLNLSEHFGGCTVGRFVLCRR
jgi:hypothetical protein